MFIVKTALVLGGTRFFGVNLVEALLNKGVAVTIGTRQNSGDPFGNAVERIQLDRFDLASMQTAVKGRTWDVVFDQLCYSSVDAEVAVIALEGKVKRYVFTSTLSVYDDGGEQTEERFDSYSYTLKMEARDNVTYQEGKRQAEAYFYQKTSMPVVAMRIPIVMGETDYTERLLHYVTCIKNDKPIYLPNPNAEMCFIHQKEAGDFLAWAGEQSFTGPINASANGQIAMKTLMGLIGENTGGHVHITSEDQTLESPYGISKTWSLSNEKAAKLGYKFSNLMDWLPDLIHALQQSDNT